MPNVRALIHSLVLPQFLIRLITVVDHYVEAGRPHLVATPSPEYLTGAPD